MISTTGSRCSASSDRTVSTTLVAVERSGRRGLRLRIDRALPGCGAHPGRRTRTAAHPAGRGRPTRTRRDEASVERSAHARNSEVFPLPGGAEMTVTRLVTARSSIRGRLPDRAGPGRRTRPQAGFLQILPTVRCRQAAHAVLTIDNTTSFPATRPTSSRCSLPPGTSADRGTDAQSGSPLFRSPFKEVEDCRECRVLASLSALVVTRALSSADCRAARSPRVSSAQSPGSGDAASPAGWRRCGSAIDPRRTDPCPTSATVAPVAPT